MVAGEASADRHASKVIKALKDILPDVEIFGMGGPEMGSCGMECIYSIDDLSVMGFTDVLPRLRRILRVFFGIKRLIRDKRPDIFVPIDLPDFNMRMARFAKARGLKVLYYIAPQAWAWRRYRAKILSKITDGLAVIFPFEEGFFKSYGVNTRYVGHPFLEEGRGLIDVKWPPERVAILPGSRYHEVSSMLPILQGAKDILNKDFTRLKWYLPIAKGLPSELFEKLVDKDVTLSETIPDIDLAMVKSGSIAFETALLGVPEVICYKTSIVNYYLAKTFIGVKNIGMPNIVSGSPIVPELIQKDLTKEMLALVLRRYIDNETLYMNTRKAFEGLRVSMGENIASEKVATWIRDMV